MVWRSSPNKPEGVRGANVIKRGTRWYLVSRTWIWHMMPSCATWMMAMQP